MVLKPHKVSNTPYTEVQRGQRQIPEWWTEKRLISRKFQLIRMKKRRNDEIKNLYKLINEYESHIRSIESELKDTEKTLRERMKENPQNVDDVYLIRTKTGYTKGKIQYMGRWRWVHLGVTKELEKMKGMSDEKLKRDVIRYLIDHVVDKNS